MYCGQCGKKVMDNMLFCPFCGSPIVIPEQDEPAEVQAQEEIKETPAAQELPVSLFEDEAGAQDEVEEAEEVEQEDFIPLSFLFDDAEPEDITEENASEEDESGDDEVILLDVQEELPAPEPEIEPEDKPAPVMERRAVSKRTAPEKASEKTLPERKRGAKTYIPVKDINPDDLFMDDPDDDEDEYDLPDDFDSGFEEEFSFEEPEEGGFFQRHIRGIVGLILLLVLALVVVIWAYSPKGQLALARVNLAWDAETYADLGYEAYHQNSDLLAAKYYEKALAREPENYDYAHSAMVAYYEADKVESAASMLKKCVEMRPDSVQPYQEMLILYPDSATRPWEISELIRMGYERTGDPSLKIE